MTKIIGYIFRKNILNAIKGAIIQNGLQVMQWKIFWRMLSYIQFFNRRDNQYRDTLSLAVCVDNSYMDRREIGSQDPASI